jgi:hypothetical protein
LLFQIGVIRATFATYGFDYVLCLKMTGFDLPWGTWDDLLSRQNAINDKAANDVTAYLQALILGLHPGDAEPDRVSRVCGHS